MKTGLGVAVHPELIQALKYSVKGFVGAVREPPLQAASIFESGKNGRAYLDCAGFWLNFMKEKETSLKGNQMSVCDVKLYSLSTCGYCKDTKEFLNKCHINFDCVDVDKLSLEERKKVLEEIRMVNPRCAFPTIVIGDKVIVGFKEDEIKEALNIK